MSAIQYNLLPETIAYIERACSTSNSQVPQQLFAFFAEAIEQYIHAINYIQDERVLEQVLTRASQSWATQNPVVTALFLNCVRCEWTARVQTPRMISANDHSIVYATHPGAAVRYVEGTGAATIFCLAENHELQSTHWMNGSLIAQLATSQKILVLFEGFGWDDCIFNNDSRQWALQHLGLDPYDQRMDVRGWDLNLDDAFRANWAKLEEEEDNLEKTFGDLKTIHDELNQNDQRLRKHVKLLGQDTSDLQKIKQQIKEINQQIGDTEQQLIVTKRKQFEIIGSQNDLLRTVYPRRTMSMINALREAKKLQNQSDTIVVFIAGTHHFLVAEKNKMFPEFQLNSFYQELNDSEHPAAVLIPKELMNQSFAEPRPWE